MSANPHPKSFARVDLAKDPHFFVRLMDEVHRLPSIQASRRLMLQRIAPGPGQAVLDVGCGPGNDLFGMVELVSPSGRLVGLDASEIMVFETRRRARERTASVTFEVGDVQELPFPDGAFDVCHAATLLMHVADAGRAVTEMVRVVRKGGLVAVFDFDWDTMIIDHPDKQTTRTIVLSYSDSLRNGWIGRKLPRLFQERGLEVRSIDPVQISLNFTMCDLTLGGHLAALQENGMLSAVTIQQWWENLRRADERGTLLVSIAAFFIVGAKK